MIFSLRFKDNLYAVFMGIPGEALRFLWLPFSLSFLTVSSELAIAKSLMGRGERTEAVGTEQTVTTKPPVQARASPSALIGFFNT